MCIIPINPSYTETRSISSSYGIRMTNRRNCYRAARRCPVCFSNDIWTCAQIPGNVVRACMRCKCRYLNQFAESDDLHPVHRVLRSHPIPAEPHGDDTLTRGARDKTSARRLSKIRKELTPGARLLESGVRDGSMAVAPSR